MNHIISKLLIYGSMPEESILMKLSSIFDRLGELKVGEIQKDSYSEGNSQKIENLCNKLRLKKN